MSILSISDLTRRISDVFAANGCSDEASNSVARALVTAEADGLKGHGLSRVPTYLAMVKSGKIDGKWVLMEWDYKTYVLSYKFDDSLGRGKHRFELTVTDNKDNIAHYSANFSR